MVQISGAISEVYPADLRASVATDFSNASIPADSSSRSTTPRPSHPPASSSLYAPDADLRSRIGGNGWFSLDSWAGYFDVETKMVLERCWKTMYPREEYLEGVLGGQPDLYGPFWLPTTLMCALYLSLSYHSPR